MLEITQKSATDAIRLTAMMACDRAKLIAVIVTADQNVEISLGMNVEADVAISLLREAIDEIERRRDRAPETKPSVQ